ncbi:MAG: AAA family ATPase [Anaerolineales bacterium]|nr:AAA family ATPase [Anaerolineales bacterium]MCB8967297.1 AAA family ATPase [Ardenticatenaceae bacterium]
MVTRQELERAIVAIEERRTVLGAQVVDTAVAALREKLASLLDSSADAYKFLTVLVADLSGFTAMSEVMDAEQVRDMIDAMWQRLDHVIHMWGGAVDKHLGDGVIALFGLSEAEEDAAERAVQAALDMLLELTVLNERIQQLDYGQFGWRLNRYRLQMRVGVNAGPVYWGQVGSRDVNTAVGDAVTIAQQLESLAPVGGTLISESVYRPIQELFEVKPLMPVTVSAQIPPLPVYVVEHEKSAAFGPLVERSDIQTRLIGRDMALMQLQQVVQAALDGGFCQFVTVVGDVGVGKSRLLREFRRLLQMGPEVAVWYGRIQPELTHVPYGLLRDLLAQQFHIRHWQHGHVAHEKLSRGLAVYFSSHEVDDLVRKLGSFLALTDSVTAVSEQDGFAAVAKVLTAVAQNQPTLLVLDDVQHADVGSLACLEYLADVCQDVPLIFAALTRPDLLQSRPNWPQLPWPGETLTLSPLNSIDTRHLLHDLLQDVPNLPLPALDMIVASTQGNALFIKELLTYLTVHEVLEQTDEARRLHSGRLQALAVPTTLRGLYWTRFTQLAEEERAVLQKASVIGPVFWTDALCTLVGKDVASLLPGLEQQGIIRLRHGAYFPDSQEYEFQHDWWQKIAYESMPLSARVRLHRQVVDWLSRQMGELFPRLPLFIARQQALAQAT